jgi:hypothetical protein
MRSSLLNPRKPFPSIRIALIAALPLLLSGWTCSGMFESCEGVSQAGVAALSPSNIPSDTNSVPLTVTGRGFTPKSRIRWNGSTLETTFLDSDHLQATITQQTFDDFGGSAGNSVQISVAAQGSGCPISANSVTLVLVID